MRSTLEVKTTAAAVLAIEAHTTGRLCIAEAVQLSRGTSQGACAYTADAQTMRDAWGIVGEFS